MDKRDWTALFLAAFNPIGCIASLIAFIFAGMFWASLGLPSGLTILFTLATVAGVWFGIGHFGRKLTD